MRAVNPFTLGELAHISGAELAGPANLLIEGVGTLQGAESGDVTFLTNPLYRDQLSTTRASAVILSPAEHRGTSLPCLLSANPYACYAQVAQHLFPLPRPLPEIHPTAVIHPGAQVSLRASIGPHVVVEDGAQIGDEVTVGAGSFVGARVSLEKGAFLHPRVTIYSGCQIGANTIIHSGCVIGADGFGMAPQGEGWLKIPQVGRVIIGKDVEIGANTTIDRGAIDDTIIEDGVKLDNLIQIAHNCRIGAHTVIAGCTGISGSTRIGRHCRIGGGVGMVGHVEIGDRVTVSGFSLITKSIPTPGVYTSSIPSQPHREWLQTLAHLRGLSEWINRIKSLENKLENDESHSAVSGRS
ncbi:MAG: UDP-3-O-(3-hydroxymyristoyl)glucosamine N-acyltransferase [Ferrovum sp.]|nr:UDP-3-O-(3-hydroxymyristoyl)glucosamine N-acyltransferase [Ferrovum sp.]NDU86928.1 UDP-3-O-(3-hydroxymyristoyl)glucosamine N-acyltransferase [Ferrovum sp.]